ncbi:hypothetical protein LAZ67_11002500, partial [Cordylochernes scorpioides]
MEEDITGFTTVGAGRKRPSDSEAVGRKNKRGCVQTSAPNTNGGKQPPSAKPRVQECTNSREKQADFRAKLAAGKVDQCVYLEFCSDFSQAQYYRALEAKLGKGTVYQLTKMEGKILVGLSSVQLADRLIEEGLDIDDTTLRAFPLRKRAERILLGNVLFFITNDDLIAALRPYGKVVSITQRLMELEVAHQPHPCWADVRREAFIKLHDGVKLSHIPAWLEVKSKGIVAPIYVSYGIRCSLCHKIGHKRANCPRRKNLNEIATPARGIMKDETLTNLTTTPVVLLPTMRVINRGKCKKRMGRILIYTGSQRSYVLQSTVEEMGYECSKHESLRHSLFGGSNIELYEHGIYDIRWTNLDGSYGCNFEALNQDVICDSVPKVHHCKWMQELSAYDIELTDLQTGPLEILIGSDIAGKLLTGEHRKLPSGLVAVQTRLGWTLMGKIPATEEESSVNGLCTTSLLTSDLENLWRLEAIGISDTRQNDSMQKETEEYFARTVSQNCEGRYQVALPWNREREVLTDNRDKSLIWKKIVDEAQRLLASAHFNLRGWTSNVNSTMCDGPRSDRGRVLGMVWNQEEDTLACSLENLEIQGPINNGKVLSLASRIFDPVGFTCPVTLVPRLILQETWLLKLLWDEPLPENLSREFLRWLAKLESLTSISVPRWLCYREEHRLGTTLHVFCDASKASLPLVFFYASKANRKKRLTRCLKTTEEFLSGTPPILLEDIECNREIIEETHSELLVIQGKIRDFMLTSDVSEEELEQDDEEALQYTQRYKRIYKKCLALVEPRITASSPTTSEVSFASSSHHRTVKLPKIELKKFTGEIKDWLGWWAQFNKIHVDPTLEDSDKFQYLVQSMSPGTRASKLVDSYPLTAENYPKVIETLTERFGRPELLQQVYVRDLIRLMIDCSSKQQLKVTSFYDELVTHLRALESLKIEARQMSVFIFPMIEACLSEELMKAWQRSPLHDVKIDANDSTQTRVELIMEFLQKEAAAEQDRALAGSKFGLRSLKQDRNVGRQSHPAKIPTASGLFAGRAHNCIFCNKDHKNAECLAARRMSIKERRERIKNAKCCFSCLQPGHISSNCRRRITECIRCKKKHLDILCPLNAPGRESADEDKEQVEDCDVSPTVENGVSFSRLSASSLILLQTLKIKVEGATSAKVVRALLDTGSQRSYILSKTAQDLGLSPIGQESLKHVVFGGHTSESVHQEYRVNLGHASGNFKMVAKLLDQQKICGSLPRLSRGPWLKELKARRIWVPDIGKDDMEIEILLGCDVLGSIFMMKSCVLSNGLTASQTRFGWTLMGECQQGSDVSLAHHVTTMTISESSITNLWNLDVLGIMDPIEVKQRDQRDALARRHFLKTVQHSVSGRYVVSLPWTVEKAKIADNREVAMKRLEQTTKKLISLNLYEDYDDIFRGWLDDGIIEKVPAEQHDAEAFYLPHRPVVKLSSGTTPIRPVFDASSKVYRSPSLNDCLEKGPNLIEMIPNLLLRFRNGKFGVVADIKKAFLQIEVNERDRDYLRFLWYSQNGEKTEVFRHRRVVFGVNCSPFILGAVIEYHLSNVRPEHKPLAQRLQKSFYVDNLVTSVNSFEELQDLKLTATSIMDNARLELSRWEHSLDVASDTYPFERAEISKVLGICWDKREDCLSCEIPVAIPPKITKRSILSCLAQIYDPIGFLSPILIKPKILLQKAWTLKLAWDDELDRHYKDELSLWFDDLQLHKGVAIPRNFNPLMVPQKDWKIHTFVDASSEAYAAVVFLRTRVGDKVEVHMMAAKSRVAPLKRPTIPRLELLACVVGARLNKMIFEALELKDIKNVFWSDATTALAWIKRDDQWGTFVGNRVKEICRLSDPVNWRYVPSECNPADLPSRGCSLSRLIQSRWWEGPSWLKLSEEFWPSRYKDLNEKEICAERKKIAVVTTVKSTDHWYMKYFSSFIKIVRMMAWIRRFIYNLRSSTKVKGELSVKEIDEAELALLKLVQAECFPSHSIPGLNVCEVEGILRVKTKSSTAASSRLLNDRKEKTAKLQTRSGRTICIPNRLDDYYCFSVCLEKQTRRNKSADRLTSSDVALLECSRNNKTASAAVLASLND